MKTLLLSLLCSALFFSAANAQQQKNKVSLTITRHGASQTFPISYLTYNFSKIDRDSHSIDDMPAVLTFNCKHPGKFLLQAASGDTTNRIDVVITCYDKAGEKTKTIAAKNAVVTQVSGVFSNDDEENGSSFDIYSNNLTVDGVAL